MTIRLLEWRLADAGYAELTKAFAGGAEPGSYDYDHIMSAAITAHEDHGMPRHLKVPIARGELWIHLTAKDLAVAAMKSEVPIRQDLRASGWNVLKLRLTGTSVETLGEESRQVNPYTCQFFNASAATLGWKVDDHQAQGIETVAVMYRSEFLESAIHANGNTVADEIRRLSRAGGAPLLLFFKPAAAATTLARSLLVQSFDSATAGLTQQATGLNLTSALLEQLGALDNDTLAHRHFGQRDVDALTAAKTMMDEHLEHKHSIDTLATAVGLNRRKLSEGFSLLFGTSVANYLAERRMQRARELLQSNLPMTEVAAQVGYESQSSFGRAYKSAFGLTPGSERKR